MKVACFCQARHCAGKMVDPRTKAVHVELDRQGNMLLQDLGNLRENTFGKAALRSVPDLGLDIQPTNHVRQKKNHMLPAGLVRAEAALEEFENAADHEDGIQNHQRTADEYFANLRNIMLNVSISLGNAEVKK